MISDKWLSLAKFASHSILIAEIKILNEKQRNDLFIAVQCKSMTRNCEASHGVRDDDVRYEW